MQRAFRLRGGSVWGTFGAMASPTAARARTDTPRDASPRRRPPSSQRPLLERHGWIAPLLLLLLVFAAYSNSFRVPFLYDDIGAIPENSTIRRLSHLGQVLSPPRDTSVAGRPMLNLTFAVNYAVSGLEVWSYHLLNILIHAGAGLALYGLVRRTLTTPRLRGRFASAASPLALVTALLWTLHPLQTESVTYIVQRAEALVGFFYLFLFYCVVRAATAANAARARGWYAAAVVTGFFGMASKEVMATAPLLLLLYDRTFLAGTFRQALGARRWLYGALALGWVQVALVTLGARTASAGFSYQGVTPLEYARSQFGVILHYLCLSVWPHPLVFHYEWPVAGSLPAIAAAGAVVLGLAAASLAALRARPESGFCGLWFFLILAPSSSIVPIADLAYEHRMYLSLAAVMVLLVTGGDALLCRAAGARGRQVGAALAAVVIAAFAILTFARNRDYTSAVAIWQDTVAKRPDNYKAHYNLAFHLEREGRIGEAERHYREALRVRPGEREALNSLGMLLAHTGRTEEGIQCLMQALEGAPDPAETHMNLGVVKGLQGRDEEAVSHYAAALQARPGLATAHYNMANALLRLGRPAEAARNFEDALRLKPDLVPARMNLAGMHMTEGRFGEAAGHFRMVLETQPDNHKAHYGLAMALLNLGDKAAARRHVETALRIRPDFEPARLALGGM